MQSRKTERGMDIDIYFKVTDYNSQATTRIDVGIFIADLETSIRVTSPAAENEECIICLQPFKGREEINTLAYNHNYHHECIV